MSKTGMSPKNAKLAAQLATLVKRKEHQGRRWDWVSLGVLLDITPAQAQHLIYDMRKYYSKALWTIGTADTHFEIELTTSARDAYRGLVTQMKQLGTRLKSQEQAWNTLATVDPDPGWAQLSRTNARHFGEMAALQGAFLNGVMDDIAQLERVG